MIGHDKEECIFFAVTCALLTNRPSPKRGPFFDDRRDIRGFNTGTLHMRLERERHLPIAEAVLSSIADSLTSDWDRYRGLIAVIGEDRNIPQHFALLFGLEGDSQHVHCFRL
jgi:hypothetical protein